MYLRQIYYFRTVGRLGSFISASQELHISQPALSYQVKQLEIALGAPLLDRHSRGVVLTPAGAAFMRHAEKILGLADEAKAVLAEMRLREAEHIDIGVSPTPWRVLRPDLIEAFKQQEPRLDVNLRDGLSDNLYEDVLASKLHAAFCYDPGLTDRVQIVPLYSEDLFLIGPPTVVDPSPSDMPFTELEHYKILLDSRFRVSRRQIATLADGQFRLDLDVAPRLSKDLLLRTGRCTVAPHGLFHDEIHAGVLKARRICNPVISRTMCLVFQQQVEEWIVKAVTAVVAPIVKQKIAAGGLGWRAPQVRPVYA